MIPKAWYSMIEVRLILPRRPCCIPRSNRRMATLGDGWKVICQSTSTKKPIVTHNFDFHRNLSKCNPRDKNTIEHEYCYRIAGGKRTILSWTRQTRTPVRWAGNEYRFSIAQFWYHRYLLKPRNTRLSSICQYQSWGVIGVYIPLDLAIQWSDGASQICYDGS